VDFILCRGRFEIEQRLDVAAHLSSPLLVSCLVPRRQPKDDQLKQNPTSRPILS
jgi:hypothetical protein